MYEKIALELDRVASLLEERGLTKEALELDSVSNTLEVIAAGSKTGIGSKMLMSILTTLKKGQNPLGMMLEFDKKFLSMLKRIDGLNIKPLEDSFRAAASLSEKGDFKGSADYIREALQDIKGVLCTKR